MPFSKKVKVTKGAKVTYRSTRKAVATVSGKGVVKAKKAGKVKIVVKAKKGNKTATKKVAVTVIDPKPKGDSDEKLINGGNAQKDGGGNTANKHDEGSKENADNKDDAENQQVNEIQTYTVRFNANGGTGAMGSQAMTVGKYANLSANAFARSGYEFAGWNTRSDGYGTAYSDKASVSNLASGNTTLTLYAQWKSVPHVIKNGYYTVKSALGKQLDVDAASTVNNANVQTYADNGTNAQKWYFEYASDGYYKITNAASGKDLIVYNASSSEGANVVQYSSSSVASHLWLVKASPYGGYVLVNKQSGKALTVVNNKIADGANVAQSVENNATGQRWYPTATQKIASGSRTVSVGVNVTEKTDYNGLKTTLIPDGTYLVRNVNGKYLDVDAENISAGANVQTWSHTGSNAQYWIFRHKGDGYYAISSACSNLRLDAENGGTANGTNVRQWYVNSGDAELWRAELVGNTLVFVNKYSGRALDVTNCSSADGANVQVWDRSDNSAQKWTLSKANVKSGTRTVNVGDYSVTERINADGYMTVEIPNGTYCVQNVMGRYLDVAAASSNSGANVQIWEGNGTNAQRWYIQSAGSGYYTLKSSCSGLMLDALNGSKENGTNVQQCGSNGGDAQLWFARAIGDSLVFINKASGLALDVNNGVNADGTNVQTWARHDGNQQKWRLRKQSAAPVKILGMTSAEYETARSIFDAYNNFRVRKGVGRVVWSDYCASVAYNTGVAESRIGKMQHKIAIPADQQMTYSDILQYATWRKSGASAVETWAYSEGHHRMMRNDHGTTEAGVGVYYDGSRWWYTIVYNFVGRNQYEGPIDSWN